MSAHSFPFGGESPGVTLTLAQPDPTVYNPPTREETFCVDTGFSDYLQLDWATFLDLGLNQYTLGTLTAHLADGSLVTDVVALVRVLIPECGIDIVTRCLSSPGYGKELLLVGSALLRECQAVIDYPRERTTLSA